MGKLVSKGILRNSIDLFGSKHLENKTTVPIILDEGGNNIKQIQWLLEAIHVFDRIGKVRERLKKY